MPKRGVKVGGSHRGAPIWSRQMEYAKMRQGRVRAPRKAPEVLPVDTHIQVQGISDSFFHINIEPNLVKPKYVVTAEIEGKKPIVLHRRSRREAEGLLIRIRKKFRVLSSSFE